MADADSTDDWEATALRQVARRIESLMSERGPEAGPGTPSDAAADEGFGWEESVLRRLRARLFSDEFSD